MIPDWVFRDLDGLKAGDSWRSLLQLESPSGPIVRLAGRPLVNLSSNDYLSLAGDPRLAAAAGRACLDWGSGAGASRLISGSLGLHSALEEALAELKGAEACILFSTGYHANLGLLQAIMPEGVIFSDELNHASIVDGCRLSRARVAIYRHRDVGHLAALFREHRSASRKLVVTDGVFSMDGDLAPLPELVELARQEGALLLVDDAHATGVLGEGRGTAAHYGLEGEVDLQMGTLGKALGSFGAFVACPTPLRELLTNRARSLIYTTAPPPPCVGAALEAVRILREEPERLATLAANAARLRRGLRDAGFPALEAPTPIVPLVLGENRRALRWSERLRELGWWAHAIRPPTVPEGTSRLRIAVCAGHTAEQMDGFVEAVARLKREEP
ncbi:MAG: 8-amino-7-oxononanoate synthase [Deltaproteobacteria bacterium]|nr:8-amino-7-oxononanoate synthase [Deltaproteobacteria bacterium]